MALNSIVIRSVRKSRSYLKDSVRGQRQKENSNSGNSAKNKQITIMLLFITFAFLILTCPQYIRYIIYTFYVYNTSPEAYASYIFATHVSNKIYFSNNAVNFFLYCLGGSKFREDLKAVFCGRVQQQRQSTSTTISMASFRSKT